MQFADLKKDMWVRHVVNGTIGQVKRFSPYESWAHINVYKGGVFVYTSDISIKNLEPIPESETPKRQGRDELLQNIETGCAYFLRYARMDTNKTNAIRAKALRSALLALLRNYKPSSLNQ